MESEVLKVATSQGLWAAIGVTLIFYIIRTQEKRDSKQEEREAKYQDVINSLTDRLSIMNDIKNDVEEIKESIIKNNITK